MNYYGSESIKVSDTSNGNWIAFGTHTPEDSQMFLKSDLDNAYKTYVSISKQNCEAQATLWSLTNGKADNNELNERYWTYKEGQPLKISSGFRVWDDHYSTEPISQAEAPDFEYTLYDFEIDKPIEI